MPASIEAGIFTSRSKDRSLASLDSSYRAADAVNVGVAAGSGRVRTIF
jgi:hypothetical protein